MGTMTGHAGLPTGPALALIGAVLLAAFCAFAVATVSGLSLETTRLNAAGVPAVGVAAKAGSTDEKDTRAATTTELEEVKGAANWTSAETGVTLALLLCVLLTQVTVLRPRVPAEASSFFPS